MKRHLLFTLFLSLLSFSLSAQSIGIIGDATPGGWDADTDMTQDPDSTDIWTIQITLTDGEVKFRQDDDWLVNWGATDFPIGIGEQDGPNIGVFAGDYFITFNTATGEYYFDVDSDIGIIGDATPGGWDEDTDMFKDQTDPNRFFIDITLTTGEAKFRQNDDWAVNWGATGFPSDTAMQDGPNIPVNPGALYRVTLDTLTGVYTFESEISFGSIGLIGDATPGGWDEDTDMTKDPDNGELWTLIITLTDGEVKFRADDDWVNDWGGTEFPTGVGEPGGPNIPVTAGDYFVTFNSTTGDYNFRLIEEFATVGIIGDATPGGWDTDTDLIQDPDDVHSWSIRMDLLDGEAKFRADNDWIVNWGAADFPSGTGILENGPNIPITAGDYIITFNSLTGVYNFREVVEYGTVGLIGKSGPFGDWENDTPMVKDVDDFNLWSVDDFTVLDFDPDDTDGSGIKFRAENDWTVNWGLVDFPAGVGDANGPNIETVAGTYRVTFNSSTGDYLFDSSSNTQDLVDPASIQIYPNPASNILNIDLDAIEIQGQVSVRIIDLAGKTVFRQNLQADQLNQLNVSDLQSGAYMLNVSNEDYLIGKRFSIAK